MKYAFNVNFKTLWQKYRFLLSCLRDGKPFDVLDNREREVLACLYAKMDMEDMSECLGINKGHIQVKLTSLRKKKLIDERGNVKHGLSEPYTLLFTFTGKEVQNEDKV